MIRTAVAAFVLGVAWWSAGAPAAEQPSRQAWAALSSLHFGYREFADHGALLDREDGVLPGIVLGAATATVERRRLAAEVVLYDGAVGYDGHTNSGLPVATRTDSRITDAQVRAEWWGGEWTGTAYALYAGLGYRVWDRDIGAARTATGRPVSGLRERIEWGWLFGGARLNRAAGAARYGLDVRLLRLVRPRLSVYDDTTLEPGERFGGRLSAHWEYALGERTALRLEPFAERWSLGRSADEPLAGGGRVFEPRSETRNSGVELGLVFSF